MKYFLSQCDQKKSFDTEIKIFFRLYNFSWIKAQFRPHICGGKKIFLLLYLGKDKIVRFKEIFSNYICNVFSTNFEIPCAIFDKESSRI